MTIGLCFRFSGIRIIRPRACSEGKAAFEAAKNDYPSEFLF